MFNLLGETLETRISRETHLLSCQLILEKLLLLDPGVRQI